MDPPAKKPRILKGSPVRVNPIYEHLYQSGKNSQEFRHTENNVSSDKNQEIPPQTAPPSNSVDPFLSEINEEGNDLTVWESSVYLLILFLEFRNGKFEISTYSNHTT